MAPSRRRVRRVPPRYKFWRVQSKYSQARLFSGDGIHARDRTDIDLNAGAGTSEGNQLAGCLEKHLDWGSRCPSPFISVYNNKGMAFGEATRRREQNGEMDVIVIEMDLTDFLGRFKYRNAARLAHKLHVEIPEIASYTAKREYIFANHIPQCAIVKVHDSW